MRGSTLKEAAAALAMEASIFMALKHLSELVGEDLTGIDDYQFERLSEAVELVRALLDEPEGGWPAEVAA